MKKKLFRVKYDAIFNKYHVVDDMGRIMEIFNLKTTARIYARKLNKKIK